MSCITLLSDFGLQDSSVAIAKGILMRHNPALPIVDISHEVAPFQTAQAAYLLRCAYKNFPAGSFHVLLCDLFSDAIPRLILSNHDGHYFLSPDNGIVTSALGRVPTMAWQCMELTSENSFNDWLSAAGRIISQLREQKNIEQTFPEYKLKAMQQFAPLPGTGEAECEIIHIDHYENVVLNITKQQFESLRKDKSFRLHFMQVEEITELSNNYNEVRPGFKLCRFNSSGYMEICINRGKAASLFGLRLGSRHNDIKLFFE